MVIAIDGPSGAGKSTVARALAKRFGLQYLDTGAMYRALALRVIRARCMDAGPTILAGLAQGMMLGFEPDNGGQRVIMDGKDVSEEIRAPEVGNLASAISVHTAVRRELVELQRCMIREGDWTLEGRDTTTVVAPHADMKVYLDAAVEVRAKRRTDELAGRGMDADYKQVVAEMRERDHRDMTRADSPLRVAEDAIVVTTDKLSAEEVVETIVALVLSRAV